MCMGPSFSSAPDSTFLLMWTLMGAVITQLIKFLPAIWETRSELMAPVFDSNHYRHLEMLPLFVSLYGSASQINKFFFDSSYHGAVRSRLSPHLRHWHPIWMLVNVPAAAKKIKNPTIIQRNMIILTQRKKAASRNVFWGSIHTGFSRHRTFFFFF